MADSLPPPAGGAGAGPRLRITFSKGEPIKYISHLDLARTWERAFRRARLPLAYSQGFNPHPRFQIAAALPVGVTGREELLDVRLAGPISPSDLEARLRPVLPAGLELLAAAEVDLHAPALQSLVIAADYRALLRIPQTSEVRESIHSRARALLETPSLPRRRQHKGAWQTYDLRPLIQSIEVETSPEGNPVLTMRLQSSPQGAGRPEEVLDALGLRFSARILERTRLYFAPCQTPGSASAPTPSQPRPGV